MRDGIWPTDDGVPPVLTLEAWVHDDATPQYPTGWAVNAKMVDNHPLAVDSEGYTTVDVGWPLRSVVARRHASALNGGIAHAGTSATLVLTDNLGQSFTLLDGGRIDENTGAATAPGHSSKVVDVIDALATRVHLPPVFAQMPVPGTPGARIRPGMCATWDLDRVLRAAGFAATPKARPSTRLAVTMMGSMWPVEAGTCLAAHKFGEAGSAPSWMVTPWGYAVADATALYSIEATSTVELTLDLPEQPASSVGKASHVLVVNGDESTGVYLQQDDRAIDEVQFGVVVGWTWTTLSTWIPRNGADRAHLRATVSGSTLTATITMPDGRTETKTHTDPAWSGWAATRVRANALGTLGGFVVDHAPSATDPAAVFAPRTALHHVSASTLQWWGAAPRRTQVDARSVLTQMAQEECAAWWIAAADGVLHYAHRGVLEAQAPAWTKSTRDLVDDITWRDDLAHLSNEVVVTGQTPSRQISDRPVYSITNGMGASSDPLVAGEEREDVFDIPADKDYVDIDLSPTVVTNATTRTQMKVGTLVGGTHVRVDDDADSAETAWTLGPYVWMPDHDKIAVSYTVDTALPSNIEVQLEVPPAHPVLPQSWRGKPLPVLRAGGVATWLDRSVSAPTGLGDIARPTVTHDAGRTVQSSTRRTQLASWLAGIYGRYAAASVSVTLDYDPRIEVGDVGTIRDADRQDVEVDMLVTGIVGGKRSARQQMTLSGRVVALRNIPDPTPAPDDWSAIMAGSWRKRPKPRPTTWVERPQERESAVKIGGYDWGVHVEGEAPARLERAAVGLNGLPQERFTLGADPSPDPGAGEVNRVELECWPRLFEFGQEWWWSFAFRYEGDVDPAGWCAVLQGQYVPDADDTIRIGPPFNFEIDPDTPRRWRVAARASEQDPITSQPAFTYPARGSFAAPGQWDRFVLRLRFTRGTPDAGLGVWQNGEQVFTSDTVRMGHNVTLAPYPKFGLYRAAQTASQWAEFANVEISSSSLRHRITAPLPLPLD